VAALPEAGRELLGAAAVIGHSMPGALLFALALQPEREALAALEGICQARLLLEHAAGEYTFAHDLIREVILGDLSVGRRRLLHRLVAQALEQQSGELPARKITPRSRAPTRIKTRLPNCSLRPTITQAKWGPRGTITRRA
jgi:predicted ATPase